MKNKLLLIVFCLICFMSTDLYSQISVGVKGGINLPNIDSPMSGFGNKGYKTEVGYEFGILVNIPVTETFSIEPRIGYSAQSGKREGMQAFPIPGEFALIYPQLKDLDRLYFDIKSQIELNYILVPIFANFGWDFGETGGSNANHFRFYVEGGPQFGFLLDSELKLSDTKTGAYTSSSGEENIFGEGNEKDIGPLVNSNALDINDEFRKFTVGISGNVGVGYHFGQNSIFVEVGGNYGFTNIQKRGGSKRPGALTAGIGYARKI